MTTTETPSPFTKSGRLTAAAKRQQEADRIEWARKAREESAKRALVLAAVEEMEEAGEAFDALDAQHGDEPQTERERRIVDKAVEKAVEKAEQKAAEECEGTARYAAVGDIDDAINRIKYLGLDADKAPLEVLDDLRHALITGGTP